MDHRRGNKRRLFLSAKRKNRRLAILRANQNRQLSVTNESMVHDESEPRLSFQHATSSMCADQPTVSFLAMEEEKKRRFPNFTVAEKYMLLSLINKHKKFIESKKCDAVTWRQKNEAWEKVTALFNANSTEEPRLKCQIKNKYEGLKKEWKRRIVDEMTYSKTPRLEYETDVERELFGPMEIDLYSTLGSDCSQDVTYENLFDIPAEEEEDLGERDEEPIPLVVEVIEAEEMLHSLGSSQSPSHPKSTGLNDPDSTKGLNDPNTNERDTELKDSRSRKRKSIKLDAFAEEMRTLVKLEMEVAKRKMQANAREHEKKMKLLQLEIIEKEESRKQKSLEHERNLTIFDMEMEEKKQRIAEGKERLKILQMETKEKEWNLMLLEYEVKQKLKK